MGRKVITVWLVLLASLGITWAADQYGKGGVEHLYWGGSHSQIRYYTGDTLTISGLVPIDVRAWGATGDGSTDDQDSLQVLIDSIGVWGGGEIYFPEGDYSLDTCLVLVDNLTMTGDGSARLFMADNSDVTMLFGQGVEGVTIRNLILDGRKDNNTAVDEAPWYLNTCGAIILRSGARYVRILDNRIKNFDYGVTASGESTQHVEISGNHFDSTGNCIDTYGRGYVISNNIIENCADGDYIGAAGIQLEVASGYRDIEDSVAADTSWTNFQYLSLENSVHGNTIRNVAGPAMSVHGGDAGVSIIGNSISNAESGIVLYYTYVKNSIVANNTIRNIHGGEAVTPWESAGAAISMNQAMGLVVSGNNIEYANTGIYAYKSKRLLVSNNYIGFAGRSGICAYADSGGMYTGNLVYNAQWPDSVWYGNSGLLMHSCYQSHVTDNRVIEDNSAGGNDSSYTWCGVQLHTGNHAVYMRDNTSVGTYKGTHRGDALFDVIAFGAIGDGSTDDTDVIQQTVDAAETAGGGEVYFPFTSDGYSIDEITITDADVRLIGPSIPDSLLGGAPRLLWGVGTPEGSVWAPIGSIYQRSDGVADSVLYVKTTGTDEDGWVPLTHND